MVCYFKPEDIEKLHAGREDMHRQFAELRDRFLGRKYQTERGHEFAYHGFSRRLGTMVRAVDVVFEKLPPELDEIPERDAVVDATLAIQAFVRISQKPDRGSANSRTVVSLMSGQFGGVGPRVPC
ncbi:hypothetical protein NKI23_26315, partial [Mesorhizobium sp. M0809]